MKQISFATLAETGKKRKTKRERFLEVIATVVPWATLMALIEPHYPKAGKGRRPRGLETMLRIDFMQQWFALSDPGMEEALYDVPCMRAFARLDLFDESMPDETTILKFRRLLEQHQLTAAIMNTINDTLEQKGLLLKGGTMVDATPHPCPALDQERLEAARPGYAPDQEGQPVVFRHEDPCRRRCEERLGPYRGGHGSQRSRCQPIAQPVARRRPGRVRRQGLRRQPPEADGQEGRRVLGRGVEVHRQAQTDCGQSTLQPQDGVSNYLISTCIR